jgi:hypothetical protein
MIKTLKYSIVATVVTISGCGCTGIITRQPYSIKKTNKGYDLGTTFWGFRIGPSAGAESKPKQNDSKKGNE